MNEKDINLLKNIIRVTGRDLELLDNILLDERNNQKIDIISELLEKLRSADLKDEKFGAGKGFIALQIHSGGDIKVRWKNIKIKEL